MDAGGGSLGASAEVCRVSNGRTYGPARLVGVVSVRCRNIAGRGARDGVDGGLFELECEGVEGRWVIGVHLSHPHES